ncbi:collagen alpha-1(II) chain-like [Gadus macrocephalus]|uniref:collagen alpha-1(II) chain-like n=1 Tax=Gadus macrocephalus TaxID=80720 RepID=UPI0028CB8464|nr:collagen alpha-1(II) chain-like [Gadus macrocephalus]
MFTSPLSELATCVLLPLLSKQPSLNKSINNITMVFEEESTSVSPVDIEGFTLQNKSPLSCPPCPPVSLSPCRVATPAGSPLPSLTQAQAFSLNKNSTLCLPVFSADNKLLWVHSNSITKEVAHAADTLDGAFEVFPYPKREEMAKLARRCSLHVDHVRVWFMFQRLHYGISWDYADICTVRRRLLGPGRRRSAKAAVVVGGEDDPQAVREEKEEAKEEEEAAAREDVLEEAGERGSSERSGSCVKMGARGVATEKGEEGEGRGGGSGETGESTASPTPPPVSSVRRPYGRPRRLLGPGRRRPARASKAAVVVGEDDPQAVREQVEEKEEEAEKEEEEEEEEAAAREEVLEEAGERGSSEGSGSCVKMGARGVATEKGEEGEGRGGGSGETGVRVEVGGEEEEQGQEGRVETPGRPCKRKLGEENEKGKKSARGKGDMARVRKGAKSTEEDPPKRKDGEPGRVEGGMALLTNQEPVPESTASPTPPPVPSVRGPCGRHSKKKKKTTPFDLLPKVEVSEIPLASKGPRGPPGAGENHAGRKADSTATVSGDHDGVDGVTPGNGSAHGNTSALGDLGTSKAKARPPDAKPKNKTKEQLRRAFLFCQYPNPCDYDWLSEWTGLQRSRLTQWFGDTRYEMKNSKPRWITPGDQQRVLARMRQRQRMKHLSTGEAGAGREAASGPGAGTWRLKLEERSAIPIPTATLSTTPPPAH